MMVAVGATNNEGDDENDDGEHVADEDEEDEGEECECDEEEDEEFDEQFIQSSDWQSISFFPSSPP
jgi:hypothetical protein